MALLERVTLLIKANLNDLLDKAESPEKLLKQLQLDMQNQFMQVKTQLAAAVANQSLLQQKQRENLDAHREWLQKAELAVGKGQDDLARAALERALTHEHAAADFASQAADQSRDVQQLREALQRLEQKMAETKAKSDLLLAQHRKARIAVRANGHGAMQEATLGRVRGKVMQEEAASNGAASAEVAAEGLDRRLEELSRSERVDQLLETLRQKTRAES